MQLVFMKHQGVAGIERLPVYRDQGGYETLRKALEMAPADLIDTVDQAQIRGRGGAGFSMGRKWKFVPPKDKVDKPTYLAINADEGEPGTFKDRWILEHDPHLMLEGIAIACWALQCHKAFIYIRGEFVGPIHTVQRALDECYAAGIFGKKLMGKDFEVDVLIHQGAGAYICGEETGLLNSIEGKAGQPSLKPPFPAIEGLWASPTIVNNVESLAALPDMLKMGVDDWLQLGDATHGGTKLYSISGHVKRPGVYEARHNATLRTLIYDEAYCQGLPEGRTLKAVIPGGSSSPVLTPDEIDVEMSFDGLKGVGSMLGSAGTIVLDDTTDIVAVTCRTAQFYAHESCGQCTPCREGTGWMHRMLCAIRDGQGQPSDLDVILDVCDQIEAGRTICALADGTAWPIRAFIKKFRGEFDAYIERGGPAPEHQHFATR